MLSVSFFAASNGALLIFFCEGGVKWDSAFYKLERSRLEEGGRKSSWWHGDEEMGNLGRLLYYCTRFWILAGFVLNRRLVISVQLLRLAWLCLNCVLVFVRIKILKIRGTVSLFLRVTLCILKYDLLRLTLLQEFLLFVETYVYRFVLYLRPSFNN